MKHNIKALESDELKSAFLQNLSHEIRTPLNAIVGFSNLMFNEDIGRRDKGRYKKLVETNNDHLIRIIDDMIDLSLIETKQFSAKMQKVSINSTLHQEKEIFEQLLKEEKKDLFLHVQLLTEDIHIVTDETRLEQVLRNLLANAIKFTSEGGVTFGCEIIEEKARFFVSDTGIGIQQKDKEKVFNRFTKISNNPKVLYRGLGLGLFMTKRILDILGGKIWFESEYQKGSTFYFTLPLS